MCFSGKVAPAGDERYVVFAVVAAAVVLTVFFLPQWKCGFKLLWLRLCVGGCAVIGSFAIFGSSLQWNGCMNIAMLCCYVVVVDERRG